MPTEKNSYDNSEGDKDKRIYIYFFTRRDMSTAMR